MLFRSVADDQFVQVPTQELIAPLYLDQRAQLIDLSRAPTSVSPGAPAGQELFDRWGRDGGDDAGTTHISIVDQWGNAVAMTATKGDVVVASNIPIVRVARGNTVTEVPFGGK